MADERGDLEVGASWRIDDVPPQQDRVPPQADRVPPQVDRVPPLPPPEPEEPSEGTLQRRVRIGVRATAVTALVVATLTFGLAEPLRMWNHGWSSAQHLRGTGGGGGVFTVTACGASPSHRRFLRVDQWRCTGTFTQHGTVRAQVSVYDDHQDHAGVIRKGYSESDGSISLAKYEEAGALFGWWTTLALGVFLIEAAVCFSLARWILGTGNIGGAMELAAVIVTVGEVSLAIVSIFAIFGLALLFLIVQS